MFNYYGGNFEYTFSAKRVPTIRILVAGEERGKVNACFAVCFESNRVKTSFVRLEIPNVEKTLWA